MRSKPLLDRGLRIADWTIVGVVVLSVLVFAVAAWADTQAERAARLAKLSPAEKEELLRKKQRFDKLEPEERDRLRRFHESLSAVPDADQLHGVLIRYSNWLKALQPNQRSAILDLPPDQRIARIKELVQIQEGQRFRDFVEYNLPPEDQEAIYKWLDNFVAANERKIIDAIRDDRDRHRIRDIADDQARRRMLITRLGARRFDARMPFPSKEEVNAMVVGLSPETRSELDKAKDPEERQGRSYLLVGAAISSIAFPPPSEEELLKFYAELSAEKRAPLEHLDADQLQPTLRKLYRMEKFGQQGGPWGGPWRGGPRPPGGDGPRGRGGFGPGALPPPEFQPPPGFASPAPADKKK
jgi:hypothetical protein